MEGQQWNIFVNSVWKKTVPPSWTEEAYRPHNVASTHSAVQAWRGGGGDTPSCPGQEVPYLVLDRGILHPVLPEGAPHSASLGLRYPQKGPVTRHWGTSQWKYYGMEMGYHPHGVWTDSCENSTFPILWMRAVRNKDRRDWHTLLSLGLNSKWLYPHAPAGSRRDL